MFYAERAPAPTRASSPRQLPTDHGHAVPTREYQSDQSSRKLLAVIGPAVPKGQRGTKPTVSFPFGIPILPSTQLQAHQQERVPATPPVADRWGCQNGARSQGFATPRQTPARP